MTRLIEDKANSTMGQTAGSAAVDVANLGTSVYGLSRPVLQPIGGFKLFNTGSQDFVPAYTQMTKGALRLEVFSSGVGVIESYERNTKQCGN